MRHHLGNQLEQFVGSSPIGFLLQLVALLQVQLVGVAVIMTELVVGLLVTSGVPVLRASTNNIVF